MDFYLKVNRTPKTRTRRSTCVVWGRADAIEKLISALDDARVLGHKSLLVQIDPATPTSGETLFQPVGRCLVEAKENGRVSHCHPVVEEDSGGFFVVFQELQS